MTDETINKVLQGGASSKEAANVADWFQHPAGAMELVERIDVDLNKEWERKYPYSSGLHVSVRHILSRVAVCLLIVAGCLAASYSGYRYFLQPVPVSSEVAYAARGERTQIVLQDGTRIYLNSESQVTFPSRFNLLERRVQLKGEAYFDVSHNPHRPFVVEMGSTKVTVLGTRFNASSYSNQPVRVMLDEGSVRFSAPEINDVLLKPGDLVCYDAQSAMVEVAHAPVQSAGEWRNHRINVYNASLAEMIGILERRYDITFSVNSPECYQHSYTLSMGDDDLNDVLQRMSYISSLHFRYDARKKQVSVHN